MLLEIKMLHISKQKHLGFFFTDVRVSVSSLNILKYDQKLHVPVYDMEFTMSHPLNFYRGESPAEAEAGLLDTARKVETYGMKLCAARVSFHAWCS